MCIWSGLYFKKRIEWGAQSPAALTCIKISSSVRPQAGFMGFLCLHRHCSVACVPSLWESLFPAFPGSSHTHVLSACYVPARMNKAVTASDWPMATGSMGFSPRISKLQPRGQIQPLPSFVWLIIQNDKIRWFYIYFTMVEKNSPREPRLVTCENDMTFQSSVRPKGLIGAELTCLLWLLPIRHHVAHRA